MTLSNLNVQKNWFYGPSFLNARGFKHMSTPSRDKVFFVSKYGNIYIKRCVLKNSSEEKKPYLKILSVAWDMAKKLPKKTRFWPNHCFLAFFASFLVISRAPLNIFWWDFFLAYIFQYASFDVYIGILWDRKFFDLRRGLKITKMAGILPIGVQNSGKNHFCS